MSCSAILWSFLGFEDRWKNGELFRGASFRRGHRNRGAGRALGIPKFLCGGNRVRSWGQRRWQLWQVAESGLRPASCQHASLLFSRWGRFQAHQSLINKTQVCKRPIRDPERETPSMIESKNSGCAKVEMTSISKISSWLQVPGVSSAYNALTNSETPSPSFLLSPLLSIAGIVNQEMQKPRSLTINPSLECCAQKPLPFWPPPEAGPAGNSSFPC